MWDTQRQKWKAKLNQVFIGFYDTELEAAEAIWGDPARGLRVRTEAAGAGASGVA